MLSISVLKLLKMEATTKASEAAGTAVSSSTAGSAQQPVDGGGGGGGGGTGAASLDNNSEFYNTGRVGRRNALPDILNHHHSTTSTADLPDKLGALSTTGVVFDFLVEFGHFYSSLLFIYFRHERGRRIKMKL